MFAFPDAGRLRSCTPLPPSISPFAPMLCRPALRRAVRRLSTAAPTPVHNVRCVISAAERDAGTLTEPSIRAAIGSLQQNGVVVLEDAIDTAWIARAHQHAGTAFERCMSRPYPGGELAVGKEHGYAEVVQRAAGRYDMLDGINGEPVFVDGAALVSPIVERLLGSDVHMLFNGLLMTTSPSAEQLWHADGEHLFSGTHPTAGGLAAGGTWVASSALPVHCINVFVPLVDLTLDNGVTEFCVGTHDATGLSPEIVWQKDSWRAEIGHTAEPVATTCTAGAVILFDYRILHRGSACREGQRRRPVLYYTFARRWFSDNLNFPRRSAPLLD